MRRFLLIHLCLLLFSPSRAQLEFDTLSNVEEMVNTAFLSEGVQIRNISYRGFDQSIRVFSNSRNKLPIEKGLFLGTGHFYYARGPNYSGSTSFVTKSPGDYDLQRMAGFQTYDASVLEFDFIPNSDEISFRYLFASEEYPEYVGSKFNDVFAFFISGPGIRGNKNLAVLPRSGQMVAVNTVNHRKNKDHYIDNSYVMYDPFSMDPDSNDLQFDGFTKMLIAKSKVIPGEVYHLKICIADVRDNIYDSGVFLEAGSFKSTGSVSKQKTNARRSPGAYFMQSVRSLDAMDAHYSARIVFNDSAMRLLPEREQFMHRLDRLMIIIQNYPEADLEIFLGQSNKVKEQFVAFLKEELIKKGIETGRISITRTDPEKGKKKKRKGSEPVEETILYIKQKSRQPGG